ncbi:MAG: hypothetical protein Fur002_09590 [Anaerolineales bacterium]
MEGKIQFQKEEVVAVGAAIGGAGVTVIYISLGASEAVGSKFGANGVEVAKEKVGTAGKVAGAAGAKYLTTKTAPAQAKNPNTANAATHHKFSCFLRARIKSFIMDSFYHPQKAAAL